jgi:hypothetical protein
MSINDGQFSIEEKVNLLFKKFLGKPSASNNFTFNVENGDSRQTIFNNQIWTDSDIIPLNPPDDIGDNGRGLSIEANLPIIGDNGFNLNNNYFGKASTDHDYVTLYRNIELIHVPGSGDGTGYTTTGGIAFKSPVDLINELEPFHDVIPFNYGYGNFTYRLKDVNDSNIDFGVGQWVVDPEAGILTFYDIPSINAANRVVNKDNPPKISFYKYTGRKGHLSTGISGLTIANSANTTFYTNVTDLVFNSDIDFSLSQGIGPHIANINIIPQQFAIGESYSNKSLYPVNVLPISGLIVEGNVGIGVTDPVAQLHVNGVVFSTGNAGASDRRWKKNIVTLDNALDKISQINGVYYDWKITHDDPIKMNFSEDKQIGFIAQNIEEVYPELVSTDKRGYKSVYYDRITAVLLESIKELHTIVKHQNDKINFLENKIKLIH